jgi:5-(carboxyamino)imidazole ribonucleotide synthase
MSQPTSNPVGISGSCGILGGGQLGCMLADAALALGLELKIYAEAGSPAGALFPGRVTIGSLKDEKTLRSFFTPLSVVVFENEFLDCDLLERAARGLALRFAPGLPAIRELQDKLRQKEIFSELKLPSAEFLPIHPQEDAAAAVEKAYKQLQGNVVFKWSRMGYDGKGVCLSDDSPAGRQEALAFCQVSLARGVPVYAERKIAFRQELAIIGCRQVTPARFTAYPLVLSEQVNGICKRVLGPATALGVHPKLQTQAVEAARKLAQGMNLEGAFAIELFVTDQGELSINEIAPRVHNSGHYTQDACETSQFENHWRAVLGMELGATSTTAAFGMLNLLGPEDVSVSLPQSRTDLPFAAPPAPLKLHWYAKSQVRPWRKVGHVNGTLLDPGRIESLQEEFSRYETLWATQLSEIQKRNPASP